MASRPGTSFWRRLRGFGPAMALVAAIEVVRAGLGVGLAVFAVAVLVRLLPGDGTVGFHLIAPMGATAVLVFATPNSPLAQPWSAVVGNTTSALVAVLVLHWVPPPFANGLAVAAALAAMLALRALHPPGAAIALLVVLEHEAARPVTPMFALLPVAAISLSLVLLAVLWNAATGRRYPFRQPSEAAPPAAGTRTAALPPEALLALLERFNQSQNLGAADLARMLAEAEAEARAHLFATTPCGAVMTQNPRTVPPGIRLADLPARFAAKGDKSLPVTDPGGRYLGVLSQGTVLAAMAGPRGEAEDAETLMARPAPVSADTPLALLLGRLADGTVPLVPVTEGARLVGVVTRSDILAVLLPAVPEA
jgi:CBS domain-containing membrane protein